MSEPLSGRALDAKLAEAMGWTLWENFESGDYEGPDDVTVFAPWGDGVGVYLPEDHGEESFKFSPSTDVSALEPVYEEIERRGLGEDYIRELRETVLGTRGAWNAAISYKGMWSMWRATPEQRARAALSVLTQQESR